MANVPFKALTKYRHPSMYDIDIVPVEVVPTENGANLKVKYWNRHYNIFTPDDKTLDWIFIPKEQFKHWGPV